MGRDACSLTHFWQPTLLNLFDTHYLPLQAGLRPAMKSFILALLPGLEEETGEFFDNVRVQIVVDKDSLTTGTGSWSTGQTLRNCFTIILPSEYLVDNADFTLCSGHFSELSIAPATTAQTR